MSKFSKWMSAQSDEFIKEVFPDMKIQEKFRNVRGSITLIELIELDKKFINNPEGNINGSTNV